MKDEAQLREEVKRHLTNITGAGDIFALFKLLEYPASSIHDASYKRKKSSFDFKKEDEERIKEIYPVLTFDTKLPIFLLEVKSLTPSFVRSVAKTFDEQYLQFMLIFAIDYSELLFVFPNREKFEGEKPKLKLTKLLINQKDIHYTDVETISKTCYANEAIWRDVWKKWKKAFSVERVTEEFFDDYKKAFFCIRDEVIRQKIPRKESHEFTLQFLNRLMFIYFVSKKGWLESSKFVEWLWVQYKSVNKFGANEFYEKWLKQVFHKAFNNRAGEVEGLPENIIKSIQKSPYLNGGLFRKNELDDFDVKISDALFQKAFNFFEKYNFTIKEDMPLESEVAVDPQMIGYVYESLANVAEEIYDRNDLGIFYTQRVEADFMCRRSLVEYLSKHMPIVSKDKFYHLLFDAPEYKEKIEKWFDKEALWEKLEEALENVSIVDPACGSGAFLVGMLNVLAEVYKMVYKHLKRELTDFELKKRVLQYSLYGVDVMHWAIHAAELRLWLQLIVETKFNEDELRGHPLLPNLNLNLRIGDSLVQEIGGIVFSVRNGDLDASLKKRLDLLKQEKRKYFEDSSTAKFKTPEAIKAEEIRLFEEIIDSKLSGLESYKLSLENELKRSGVQTGLFGKVNVKSEAIANDKAKQAGTWSEIANCKEKIEDLKKVKEFLNDPSKKPFVWDIDFAEIFGEKKGFDIVIGNPPYVRQEMISPPNKMKSEVTLEERRAYKEKLIHSVQNKFPVITNINGKSDLYVYFYFHGLSLLNEKGTFCFITSNSWLDVGYGADLQEFLCKYCSVIAIYDNPKRSFAHADVNTIIALLGAPIAKQHTLSDWSEGSGGGNKYSWPGLKNTAKFVMFKKPFEEVLTAKNLIDIENAKAKVKGVGLTDLVKNVVKTNDYRVFPIIQEDLLEDGWEYPENYKNGRFKTGSYEGNKWGGKYLRAPDIFYTILEKGKGKLVRLNNLLTVKAGCYSGINEFFYISSEQKNKLKLESKFLVPLFKSPQESDKIELDITKLDKYILLCQEKIGLLKKEAPKLYDYIKWGGQQKTVAKGKVAAGIPWPKVPTVATRKPDWYCIRDIEPANIFLIYGINDRYIFWYSEKPIISDRRLHMGYVKKKGDEKIITLLLNSSLTPLFVELEGRINLGEGALDFATRDAKNIYILNPNFVIKTISKKTQIMNRPIQDIFSEFGIVKTDPIQEQTPKPFPDRLELDNLIFDELGLTKDERKEVYWAVCELVKQRLEKAKSTKEN